MQNRDSRFKGLTGQSIELKVNVNKPTIEYRGHGIVVFTLDKDLSAIDSQTSVLKYEKDIFQSVTRCCAIYNEKYGINIAGDVGYFSIRY